MKRRKVVWASAARRDLEAIVAYLAEDNVTLARTTLERMDGRARKLATLAERGRVVPELARLNLRTYRELVVKPYRVLYRVSRIEVHVLAVFDARRSLEDAILDRLTHFG